MKTISNIVITGAAGRPIALDMYHNDQPGTKPVVVYAHGFNGFKTWGNFSLLAERFVQSGFVCVALNFSHNGTTPADPETFTDLAAFGYNNYTKQLEDLHLLTDWLCGAAAREYPFINVAYIALIGHSMGGGISILHAARDHRIKKLVTWASISQCKTPWGSWPQERIATWRQTGVEYYFNGRTRQQMPLYYQLYEDFQQHEQQLDIEKAAAALAITWLICHGMDDTAVPVQSAHDLQAWQPRARLLAVNSDHVFGRSHPWLHAYLPPAMEEVLGATIDFLQP